LADDIHDAARAGDIVKIKALLEKDPSRVSDEDKAGNTPRGKGVGK